ncbi:MAG: YicC family protein [Lachnospiraceae bacterium]|nr:YicC family protein [Lachnospiraceae bacterium]
MIKSMTGFGRCENSDAYRRITVEIKSVNHRYFDVNVRMPRKLNFFDTAIRALLKQYVERGKVDVFLTYEELSGHDIAVTYNHALAAEYLSYMREMVSSFGLADDISVSTLSRCPEVFSMEEHPLDEEEIWTLLERTLRAALDQFVEGRLREGERLKQDLEAKLQKMLLEVDKIEARAPEILAEYRSRLETKVQELLGDVQMDESRLSAEVVIFADKICTDEETVRLRAHIHSMLDTLESGGGIGRKLDFIAQEMNREANTILSKANDLETSNIAIELKTEIEKVREQIQNIE